MEVVLIIDLKSATNLLEEKLIEWYELSIKYIPNVLVAVIVFILFLLIAKLFKKYIGRYLSTVIKTEALSKLLITFLYFIILGVGLFISLGILNLDKTVTSLLAGAGVIGLALGFAFQEIVSNFVSGILIAIRGPYRIGDTVKVDDFIGDVIGINLRVTRIMSFDGIEYLIPNKYMFTKPLLNYTTTPMRRLDISIGVSYSEDLDFVEKITMDVLAKIEGRVEQRDVEVYFVEFGDSSINLSARVWINYPEDNNYLKFRHQAIKKIKKAFDENNITIPFPIRTLDLPSEFIKDHHDNS